MRRDWCILTTLREDNVTGEEARSALSDALKMLVELQELDEDIRGANARQGWFTIRAAEQAVTALFPSHPLEPTPNRWGM